MKNRPLRIIIAITGLIIALIIFFQLSWLKKVVNYEEKEFNVKVVTILNEFKTQYVGERGRSVIDRPDETSYLLHMHEFIDSTVARRAIRLLMDKEQLNTACEVALYDSAAARYLFRFRIIPGKNSNDSSAHPPYAKAIPKEFSYLFISFPNRSKYIFSRLENWILSTALLILALAMLLVLLVNFLRQRYVIRFQRDFVNNIVHEFKTPLAVMKIASEVLNKERIAEQPDRLKKYAGIVNSQTNHLEQQVQRILQMMRSDKYDIELERTVIDTRELVNQVTTKLQPLIEDRQAVISIHISKEAEQVTGDAAHLELALVNLIENSLKYSKQPEILISASIVDRKLQISVKDNGIGIPRKYIPMLFEKFYRVPSGDIHNVKGFGLGLNFVKKVVDAHRGKIRVNSSEDAGTEFIMEIPQL